MCDKKKIVIDSKDAPPELTGCYFEFEKIKDQLNVYRFFDQGGTEIIGDLHVNTKFDFALAGKTWVLNISAASCDIVKGKWTNGGDDAVPFPEPDQPYQAQAGGTPVDTSTAAATA